MANIKITGLKETLARFDVKKYEPEIQQCFDKFGIRVELQAKQLAPVKLSYCHYSRFNGLSIKAACGDMPTVVSPLFSYRNNVCAFTAVSNSFGQSA